MTLNVYLSFFGAFLSGALAFFIYFQDPRSFVQRTFAIGMLDLSLVEFIEGMKFHSQTPSQVLFWEWLRLISESLLPGILFLFSLSFGRLDYKKLLAKWKWVAVASLFLPVSLLLFFHQSIFIIPDVESNPFDLNLPLQPAGYVFYLISLFIILMVMVNLEATFRSSVGIKRWQIKFIFLGIASLAGVRIYSISQMLLFHSINLEIALITYGTIVADILIIFSLTRNRLLTVDIYVSRDFLYNSITLLAVGIYLLAVGGLAKVISQSVDNRFLFLTNLFVFLSIVILSALIASDRVRQEIRSFISQNFYRSKYDYRKQWVEFTEGITSKVNMRDLCLAVTNMVSSSFGAPSATIWLVEESQNRVMLGGSTVFSDISHAELKDCMSGLEELAEAMKTQSYPVSFIDPGNPKVNDFRANHLDFLVKTRISYAVALSAGQQYLGILTMDQPLARKTFSVEDYDLFKVIADQTAGALLNLQLTESLIRAKELKAFQSLSAFFIHDLKNLASTLSLTIKNLPLHYQNPEFREDALKVISRSVEKINGMCSRLTLLTRKLELSMMETDLNEFVDQTLQEIQGSLNCRVVKNLLPVPPVNIDKDQMEKVLINLLFNANEAISDHSGEINIKTELLPGEKVCLSVRDNGSGISEEFQRRFLFQPFQTTKSQGLGIGLYHSQMIVEAHQGRIEVESEPGRGSLFRVILPIKTAQKN